MSESLNAGNELDDELPTDAGELEQSTDEQALNLDSEMAALESLNNRACDLEYLMQDIQKAHGMSQSFAMEAERLLPGFTKLAPVGYYTKAPTATRLKVSMEELSKGMWALIAAAAAAVIGLVIKIVSWLAGKKEGKATSKDVAEVASERKEAADAMAESMARTNDAIKDVDPRALDIKDKKGNDARTNTLTEAFEFLNENYDSSKEYSKFFTEPNPLYVELVNNGKYATAIRKATDSIKPIIAFMLARTKALEKIYNDERNAGSDLGTYEINKGALSRFQQPEQFTFDGSKKTVAEIVRYIHDLRREAEDRRPTTGLTVEKTYETLDRIMTDGHVHRCIDITVEATEALEQVTKVLEDLEEHAGKVENDGFVGEASRGLGPEIRKQIAITAEDISKLGMLISYIELYIKTVSRFEADVRNVVVKSIGAYRNYLRQTGEGASPEMEKFMKFWDKETKGSKANGFFKKLALALGRG